EPSRGSMRNVILPLALIATNSLLVACSFSMHAGDPAAPAQPPPQPPPPGAAPPPATNAPAAAPMTAGPRGRLGQRTSGPSAPRPPPSPNVDPPGGRPVVTAPTIFGGGQVDPAGFKGSIYWVPAGATKLPALASMQPNGFLFASQLNVTPQAFSGGFPGVDPAH